MQIMEEHNIMIGIRVTIKLDIERIVSMISILVSNEILHLRMDSKIMGIKMRISKIQIKIRDIQSMVVSHHNNHLVDNKTIVQLSIHRKEMVEDKEQLSNKIWTEKLKKAIIVMIKIKCLLHKH